MTDATVNLTGKPDDALADTEPLPPTSGPDGALPNVIVCGFSFTANVCVFCAAAAYVPFPDWLASITQLPAAT